MSKGNDGKWLEKMVEDCLKEYWESNPAYSMRFYDAKAARGRFPPQPGDYQLLTEDAATLIECKSTVCSTPLKALLDAGQVGFHRLWNRAGQPSLFVYADKLTGSWSLWGSAAVIELYDAKKKQTKGPEISYFCAWSLEDFSQQFVTGVLDYVTAYRRDRSSTLR